MSSKRNKAGKWFLSVGFIVLVFGGIFNKTLGLADTLELLESLSLPLIVIGAGILILSNFFTKKRGSRR